MRILLVGGGSGGHVTPLRAISQSLARQSGEKHEITLITDRKFYPQTKLLFKDEPDVRLKKIYSGKFRRYHNHSLLWHLTHLPTLLKNIRDIFLLGIGFIQSVGLFVVRRPDVVFCKGGFTCVPVGLAAHLFGVPLYIHDSDTLPGLTNRLLSRFATKIMTGMPVRYYSYDKEILSYVGIPVDHLYKPVSASLQQSFKKELGISAKAPVVLITGGGTGAGAINKIVCNVALSLIEAGFYVIHVTGKGKADVVEKKRSELPKKLQQSWQIESFTEMLPLVQAADIIISRAGATAMQEFANAKKPVVIIPSPYLTGGHQLKNAAMFADEKAAVVFDEKALLDDSAPLAEYITSSVEGSHKSLNLIAEQLYKGFAKPKAADEIAKQILATPHEASSLD